MAITGEHFQCNIKLDIEGVNQDPFYEQVWPLVDTYWRSS